MSGLLEPWACSPVLQTAFDIPDKIRANAHFAIALVRMRGQNPAKRIVQNEERSIASAISSSYIPGARTQPQVIVADGGSSDSTKQKAHECGPLKFLSVGGGRGAQLNAATDVATGEWLLFLHADNTLPQHYFEALSRATTARPLTAWQRLHREQATPRWGCFATLNTGCEHMAAVQWGVKMRTRLIGTPYGDQGLFCEKRTFQQVRSLNQTESDRVAHPPSRTLPRKQERAKVAFYTAKAVELFVVCLLCCLTTCLCAGAQISAVAFPGGFAVGAVNKAIARQACYCAVAYGDFAATLAAPWHPPHNADQSNNSCRLLDWSARGGAAPVVHQLKAQVCSLRYACLVRCARLRLRCRLQHDRACIAFQRMQCTICSRDHRPVVHVTAFDMLSPMCLRLLDHHHVCATTVAHHIA